MSSPYDSIPSVLDIDDLVFDEDAAHLMDMPSFVNPTEDTQAHTETAAQDSSKGNATAPTSISSSESEETGSLYETTPGTKAQSTSSPSRPPARRSPAQAAEQSPVVTSSSPVQSSPVQGENPSFDVDSLFGVDSPGNASLQTEQVATVGQKSPAAGDQAAAVKNDGGSAGKSDHPPSGSKDGVDDLYGFDLEDRANADPQQSTDDSFGLDLDNIFDEFIDPSPRDDPQHDQHRNSGPLLFDEDSEPTETAPQTTHDSGDALESFPFGQDAFDSIDSESFEDFFNLENDHSFINEPSDPLPVTPPAKPQLTLDEIEASLKGPIPFSPEVAAGAPLIHPGLSGSVRSGSSTSQQTPSKSAIPSPSNQNQGVATNSFRSDEDAEGEPNPEFDGWLDPSAFAGSGTTQASGSYAGGPSQSNDTSPSFPSQNEQEPIDFGWWYGNQGVFPNPEAPQTAAPMVQNPMDQIHGVYPGINPADQVVQHSPTTGLGIVDPSTILDPAITQEYLGMYGPAVPENVQGGIQGVPMAPGTIPAPMPVYFPAAGMGLGGFAPQQVNLSPVTGLPQLAIPDLSQAQMYPTTTSATSQSPWDTMPLLTGQSNYPSYSDPVGGQVPEPRQAATMLEHRRNKTERKSSASTIYSRLGATPATWGPSLIPNLFTYTEYGEWHLPLRLSKMDTLWYITNIKKHTGRALKIWIQRLPAQRNYRYPHKDSGKCRWDECPAPNGTISKGFYRVAFDERSNTSGTTTDPFHNAGYMHLHCFEKMFDIFELIQCGVAALDDRVFPHEDRNPMSVSTETPQLAKVYRNWYYAQEAAYSKFQKTKATNGITGGRNLPKEQKLWNVLTRKFVENESPARMKMRDSRGGNSIDKHLGDLDLFVAGNQKTKELLKRATKRVAEEMAEESPRTKRARRRHAVEQPSPAASHISVGAEEDEESSVGSPAGDMQPPQLPASPPAAEGVTTRRSARQRKRKVSGEDEDEQPNVPSDALRRSPRGGDRGKVSRRAAST